MGEKKIMNRIDYNILMKKRRIRTYIFIFMIIALGIYLTKIFIYDKYLNEKINYLITMNQGEYPIKDVKSNLDKYRESLNIQDANLKFEGDLEWGNNPKVIVFHHTAADNLTPEAINEDHIERGYGGIGYHYYIRRDGTIYSGRPELAVGAHTIGRNYDSIGICLEGNFEDETVTNAQEEAAVKLSTYIIIKYNLEDVMGHKDNYNTLCPGTNFPMDDMKLKIKDEILRLCNS